MMNIKESIKNKEFRAFGKYCPEQLRILQSKARFKFCLSGKGLGKTDLLSLIKKKE